MNIKLKINKTDTQIFKGVAILIIAVHNLIHKLPHMPDENEFRFHHTSSDLFFSEHFFNSPVSFVFSFMAHGVQVFIFLSAFVFYLKKDEIKEISYFSFVKKRYLRLLYPLLLSMILVSFLEVIYNVVFFNYSYETILHSFLGIYVGGFLHLTSLYPIMPAGLPGGPGPWWFISFILQAYFIFPVLFKINFNKSYYFIIAFGLSYLLIYISNLWLPEINIYYTVIGHLPEILLGIYYSVYLNDKNVKLYKIIGVMFTGLLLLLISNIYESLWSFSFSFATIFLISFFLIYRSFMTNFNKNNFTFIGGISVYIFLLNGATRKYFIYFINNYSDNVILYWSIITLYVLITVFLSYWLMKLEELVLARKNILKPVILRIRK